MRYTFIKYTMLITCIIALGALLMDVSHRVQRAERQIARVNNNIEAEQENIRVLKAEWAFLNAPERLEKLAKEGLDLAAPSSDALVSDIQSLPENVPTPSQKPSSAVSSSPQISPLFVETSLKTPSVPSAQKGVE